MDPVDRTILVNRPLSPRGPLSPPLYLLPALPKSQPTAALPSAYMRSDAFAGSRITDMRALADIRVSSRSIANLRQIRPSGTGFAACTFHFVQSLRIV